MNFFNDKTTRISIYLALVMCFYLSFMYLRFYLQIDGYSGGYFRWLLDSLLFALPVLFCRKRWIVCLYLAVINLYLLSIVWYYHTYGTIMPLSSYLMFGNLKGLESSILHSIRIGDILLLLPSISFVFFYLVFAKKNDGVSYFSLRRNCILVLILIIVVGVSIPYFPNGRPSGKQPLYLFSTTEVGAFKKYGIIHFWVYQIASFQCVSDDDKRYACVFMEQLSKREICLSRTSLTSTGKNLILILVESLQSWPIGLKVGEVECVPNLNKLIAQASTVYFPKVVPQVKDGRSSDAQLLINTGLLPLTTGAASSLCASNTFPSLAAALKQRGYTSVSLICDEKNYWNQEATTIAYGFDKLYDGMQGDKERKNADENLFSNSLSIMRGMKCPFYAQLVTLSSHEPYIKPILPDSPLMHEVFENDEVRNYLIAIQYVDKCIMKFVEGLKQEGLYDDSVIIITGDHEQMTFNTYESRAQAMVEDYFIPFIILNSPLDSEHTDKVLGQIDIYPSLLDLMGCYDYIFKGLGETVFRDSISNYAIFRTGLEAGEVGSPEFVKQYRKECWKISDILLRMDYFASR